MTFDAEALAMIESARQRSLISHWITIEQAAAMLGVSVRTLRRRDAAGEMPERFRRGRRLCYRIEQISDLARSGIRPVSVERASDAQVAELASGEHDQCR